MLHTRHIFKAAAAIILCGTVAACAGVSNSELTRAKTIAYSREAFATKPFGFALTHENLTYHYGNEMEVEHYQIHRGDNEVANDVYRWYRGKSEILTLAVGDELKIISADIYSPKIMLFNEIHVGLSRKEFFWKFSDWLYDDSDRLTVHAPKLGCAIRFVFSRNRLKSIHFENMTSKLNKMKRNIIAE